MRIKYDYHEDKRFCCYKEKQHRATVRWIFARLPHVLTGCGKTKKEAKDNLNKAIDNLRPIPKESFFKTVK